MEDTRDYKAEIDKLRRADNPKVGKVYVAVFKARLEKDYECVGSM